ncbi:MAG: hypothetical protein HYY53_00160 [candidate division NC10 bacterium]|nr:hypothetical protein [candidate division NC10 bacterium]
MIAIERSFEPISLELAAEGSKLELRIHGRAPEGDRFTFLAAKEARLLAYRLLAEAEAIRKEG